MFFHTVTASVLSSSSVNSEPLLPSSVFLFTIHFDNAIALTSWQQKFNTSEDYLRTICFFHDRLLYILYILSWFFHLNEEMAYFNRSNENWSHHALPRILTKKKKRKKIGGRKEPVWKQLNSIIDCPKYTCASYAKSISNCRSYFGKNRKWFVLDRS